MRQCGIPDMDFTNTMIGGVASVLRSDGGAVMWPRIRDWFDPEFAAEVEKTIEAGGEKWLDVMLGADQLETSSTL